MRPFKTRPDNIEMHPALQPVIISACQAYGVSVYVAAFSKMVLAPQWSSCVRDNYSYCVGAHLAGVITLIIAANV